MAEAKQRLWHTVSLLCTRDGRALQCARGVAPPCSEGRWHAARETALAPCGQIRQAVSPNLVIKEAKEADESQCAKCKTKEVRFLAQRWCHKDNKARCLPARSKLAEQKPVLCSTLCCMHVVTLLVVICLL